MHNRSLGVDTRPSGFYTYLVALGAKRAHSITTDGVAQANWQNRLLETVVSGAIAEITGQKFVVHEFLPTSCEQKAGMYPSVELHAVFAAPPAQAQVRQCQQRLIRDVQLAVAARKGCNVTYESR